MYMYIHMGIMVQNNQRHFLECPKGTGTLILGNRLSESYARKVKRIILRGVQDAKPKP